MCGINRCERKQVFFQKPDRLRKGSGESAEAQRAKAEV